MKRLVLYTVHLMGLPLAHQMKKTQMKVCLTKHESMSLFQSFVINLPGNSNPNISQGLISNSNKKIEIYFPIVKCQFVHQTVSLMLQMNVFHL